MKKTGIILLLLLIFQYTFGLFAVYVWNSVAIRQSMKEAIATGSFQHSRVTTITVSLQRLTPAQAACWQQDEISIKGKMYDVVAARQAGDQLTIKCICDDDENQLTDSYRLAVENKHKDAPDKSVMNIKSILSPFVVNDFVVSILQAKNASATNLLQYQTAIASYLFAKVITPPPRQA